MVVARASEKGRNSALVLVRRSFWSFFYKGTYRTKAGTIAQRPVRSDKLTKECFFEALCGAQNMR